MDLDHIYWNTTGYDEYRQKAIEEIEAYYAEQENNNLDAAVEEARDKFIEAYLEYAGIVDLRYNDGKGQDTLAALQAIINDAGSQTKELLDKSILDISKETLAAHDLCNLLETEGKIDQPKTREKVSKENAEPEEKNENTASFTWHMEDYGSLTDLLDDLYHFCHRESR